MRTSLVVKLALSIALPLGVGAIAGMFTTEAIPGWYATLHSPSFNPPNWLFGPVWTILYFLLGISFFLIWKIDPGRDRNRAMVVFIFQLLLNFGWSFLFFYFKRIDLALIEIIVLWVSILAMIRLFYKIRPIAAYLNVPYLLWVTFATVLNAAYYLLN